MNQGRIWTVVHPTVGLPLFLGSVALTSLAVHASVMSHTTWMSNFWQGNSKDKPVVGSVASPVALNGANGDSPYAITVTPVPAAVGAAPASFVVTVTPSAKADGVTTASSGSAARASGTAALRSASAN